MINYGFRQLCNLHYGHDIPFHDETTYLILEKCYNLYLSRFKIKNMPEEMQRVLGQRNFIDSMLFFQPSVAFFKHETLGVQCLPTTGNYKFNLVGRPVEWTVRGFNGFTQQCNEENSVLMFNDEAMTVPFLHILYEIKFMRDLDETTRQNIYAQRQPYIIEADEDTLKTAQIFSDELSRFKPIIFKRKTTGGRKNVVENFETKVHKTDVPFDTKDFLDVYNEFFNRILTYLGYNNINVQDKKERLITSEASANDMLIQSYYTSALNQREIAIKKANEMFGLNMSVEKVELQSMVTAIANEYSAGIVQAETKNINKGNSNGNNNDDT